MHWTPRLSAGGSLHFGVRVAVRLGQADCVTSSTSPLPVLVAAGGCSWRALVVWLPRVDLARRPPEPLPPSGAYRSALTVTVDGPGLVE